MSALGRWARVGLAAALLTVAGRGRVQAQATTFQLTVQALLASGSLTVSPLRDLNFGTVTVGVPTAVPPTAAAAGQWQVTGTPNAFVTINLTLPTVLDNVQGVPGITMPIAFGTTSARWRRDQNDPNGASVFDPSAGATGRLGPPPRPNMYVWLGGTVTPAPTQAPGIYRGTIVLTVAYL